MRAPGLQRQLAASGVKEYRLRRKDGAAWREIGEGKQKTRSINGLARAALEREREVGAYRAEAVDRGRFSGHVQPWRRERRSGSEDSLGNRGDSLGNRVRRSGEPERFPGESRRMTTCRT